MTTPRNMQHVGSLLLLQLFFCVCTFNASGNAKADFGFSDLLIVLHCLKNHDLHSIYRNYIN